MSLAFRLRHPVQSRWISTVKTRRLTLCSRAKLENICRAIRQVRRARVPGMFLEAGCALGGSAALLGKFKPSDAALHLYDVFGLIPPPGENDGPEAHQRYADIARGKAEGLGGDRYYGYTENLCDVVVSNLNTCGLHLERDRIRLFPGLFEETLHPGGSVAFAHIDCDWYDSVRTCLERITPHLSDGAMMVFDDYLTYEGCRRAVDEWLKQGGLEIICSHKSLTVRKAPRK
jgi:hypothetical protein